MFPYPPTSWRLSISDFETPKDLPACLVFLLGISKETQRCESIRLNMFFLPPVSAENITSMVFSTIKKKHITNRFLAPPGFGCFFLGSYIQKRVSFCGVSWPSPPEVASSLTGTQLSLYRLGAASTLKQWMMKVNIWLPFIKKNNKMLLLQPSYRVSATSPLIYIYI